VDVGQQALLRSRREQKERKERRKRSIRWMTWSLPSAVTKWMRGMLAKRQFGITEKREGRRKRRGDGASDR
jgi:hypothetical protein